MKLHQIPAAIDAADILIDDEYYSFGIDGLFKDDSRRKLVWLSGLELKRLAKLLSTGKSKHPHG